MNKIELRPAHELDDDAKVEDKKSPHNYSLQRLSSVRIISD